MYALIRDVIAAFNGDLNKFYPKFYQAFADAEASFKGLCRNSSLLLGFELANHVLAYLSGCSFKDDVLTFKHETTQFSDKEKSIITYLSGYVVGTLYRRIRFAKKQYLYHQHYLSLLLACKCTSTETDVRNQKLVSIKNRGGLWKVNSDTSAIFSAAESYFLAATKKFTNKIDCHEIVTAMLNDSWILANLSSIRRHSSQDVKKEIAVNLLEDLLTLYIRARSHSFAKNKQQLHKIRVSKSKSRSLRTGIKKQSSSLDFGH